MAPAPPLPITPGPRAEGGTAQADASEPAQDGRSRCSISHHSVIAEAHLRAEQTAKRYKNASDILARATLAANLGLALPATLLLLTAAALGAVTSIQAAGASRAVAALCLTGILSQAALRTYRLWRQHRSVREYLATITLHDTPLRDVRCAHETDAPRRDEVGRGEARCTKPGRSPLRRLTSAAARTTERLLMPGQRAATHLADLLGSYESHTIDLAWRQTYWQRDAASLLALLSRCEPAQAEALCRLAEASMRVPYARTRCPNGSCEWPAGCRATELLEQAVSRQLGCEEAELATTLLTAWEHPTGDLTTLLDAAENAHT